MKKSGADENNIPAWSILLRVLGLVFLIAGAIRAFQSEAMVLQGTVLIAAALALFFLSILDRLKTFSISVSQLLSLQAETHDVVREARDATSELRSLAKIFGSEVLKLIVGGNRFGGSGTSREIFDRSEKLVGVLKSLGLTDEDISEIRGGTDKWTIIDYCGVISGLAELKRESDTNAVWNTFWSPWTTSFDRPPAEMLRKWLTENNWIDDEILEWIEDYRHFIETRNHRRPEAFRNRGDLRRRT